VIFTIDTDNITALDAAPPAQEGLIVFSVRPQFERICNSMPINRLVEIWNGFAGVAPFSDLKPVKKFENREKATRRIWDAIQKLANPKPTPVTEALVQANRAPALIAKKGAKKTKVTGEARTPREGTAKATVLAMIQRKGGATLDEIMKATGWQAHTCRGFMSVVPRKAGLTVTSTRRESDKARVYAAQ
jgi:hypothetical protein